MKGEVGDYANLIWLVIIIGSICCLAFLFLLKPQLDYQQKIADFDRERDVFLHNFCRNMKFEGYKLFDIDKYNAYCYNEQGMTRSVSYFTYDYEIIEGRYSFKVLQERA